MEKEKIKNLIGETQFKELLLTQLYSWELVLKKRELSQQTVDRKLKNIIDFMAHLNVIRLSDKKKLFKFNDMGKILFEYVRDGYFGSGENLDNSGTSPYRQSIYHNIAEGINYIYENMNGDKQIIDNLTSEQKEILNDISRNKWFKVCTIKNDESETFYDSMQVQLIEKLGIKVYFDEKNLPYVLSHELAELINKKKDRVLKDIRSLVNKIDNTDLAIFDEVEEHGLFSMVEDYYEVERKVGNNIGTSKEKTYRLYKNLLLIYLLGLTGQEIVEFKIKYIQAFDYIEIQYNKMLIETGKLKESFFNMYNEIRKRNRDLLINVHNKKAKKNKVS